MYSPFNGYNETLVAKINSRVESEGVKRKKAEWNPNRKQKRIRKTEGQTFSIANTLISEWGEGRGAVMGFLRVCAKWQVKAAKAATHSSLYTCDRGNSVMYIYTHWQAHNLWATYWLAAARACGYKVSKTALKMAKKGKTVWLFAACIFWSAINVGEFSRVKTRWHNLSAAIRNCCAPLAKRKRECALWQPLAVSGHFIVVVVVVGVVLSAIVAILWAATWRIWANSFSG